MSHTPKVVEVKQISNEYVAYRIICCDDPFEDTWHAKHIDMPDHDAKLEEHKMEAAARHEKMLEWRKRRGV